MPEHFAATDMSLCSGGGCSEGDGDTYRLKEDQRRDNVRVRALLNCQRTQTPVVLLAGKK